MSSRKWIASALVLAAAVGACGGAGPATSTTRSKASPVILVHGYANSCPATDVDGSWYVLTAGLRSAGFTGRIDGVQYYLCDTNFTVSIDGSGNHQSVYPTGHATGAVGHLSHTNETDFRHLAYHLAWYVYDSYTRRGRSVAIVAHSVGGLIVRWMLERVKAEDKSFPPRLNVTAVVTYSTPYDGVPSAPSVPTLEGRQATPGSDFLRSLSAGKVDSSVDWTAMASRMDEFVPVASALAVPGAHRHVFDDLHHAGYLTAPEAVGPTADALARGTSS